MFSMPVFFALSSARTTQTIFASERTFEERMDRIFAYAKHALLGAHLRAKIKSYFDYLWRRQSGLDESQILVSVPRTLRSGTCGRRRISEKGK
jgi:hypothetical protein